MSRYILVDCNDNETSFNTLEEMKNFLLWTITMEAWKEHLCEEEYARIVVEITEFFASKLDVTKTPYLFDAYLSDLYSIYERKM